MRLFASHDRFPECPKLRRRPNSRTGRLNCIEPNPEKFRHPSGLARGECIRSERFFIPGTPYWIQGSGSAPCALCDLEE